MNSCTVSEIAGWILLIIAANFHFCTCINHSSVWIKDTVTPGVVCPNDVIHETHVTSVLKCGDLCTKEISCESFTFVNTTTPNCYLMNVDPSSLASCNTEPNAKHFIKPHTTFTCQYDSNYHTYQLSDGSFFTYRIVDATVDAVAARTDCEASGGSLLKVNTITRLQFIQDNLSSCSGYSGHFYFIDGNDVMTSGVWTWDDGVPINMNSSFWVFGQPNIPSLGEHCVVMESQNNWQFHDAYCWLISTNVDYICGKELQ